VGDAKTVDLFNGVKLELVWIPPGEFMMGSNDGQPNEKPEHRVTMTHGFWMGKYKVTQEQYEAVIGKNPSYFNGAQLPVETVSWNDAVRFCRNIGARLPTEAEWEYACRAGTRTRYDNGDRGIPLGRAGWYSENSSGVTHPVGLRGRNPWGLYDMLGDVWEWCTDWYGNDYYTQSPESDPTGPSSGMFRVWRGCSFGDNPSGVDCASSRGKLFPGTTSGRGGFRVVVDAN
jgi:formylglycine-generating enzyme required for sulfatase activity